MIAYAWTVYPNWSAQPIVASGLTDEPGKARSLVEEAMTGNDTAAWGICEKVTISFDHLTNDSDLLGLWPSVNGPMICKRNTSGGFTWIPMFRSG
jgi:hypothetical protein